ncbi:MAG: hypothetical protein O7B99_12110 [Planctomycetota bacterium]|nr:hypothetical protein [Planctomycetota bacterium]
MTTTDGAFGVLCAMPAELGSLARRVRARRSVVGLEVLELELDESGPCLACVSGVGKVRAAQGAAALLAAGASRALLVVGVCGALRRFLKPGALVHCERAVQADLALGSDREVAPDRGLLEAWSGLVPGHRGWFVTADRPVLNPWRRLRLARAFAGPCVADMETAAAGAVAALAGVPWAALRAVTDRAGLGTAASFRRHFADQAGRAADTVPLLLERLRPGAGMDD